MLHQVAQHYSVDGKAECYPAAYDGRVVCESELGVVIGQMCKSLSLSLEQAATAIFGYICVNN